MSEDTRKIKAYLCIWAIIALSMVAGIVWAPTIMQWVGGG